MKTDSIFYQLFQTLPGVFFELIGQSSVDVNLYTFQSIEIKEVAKRIDGVFIPSSGSSQPIYFVEVQFQPDPKFYYRFITEIFLYLGQNQPQKDWRAVAVFRRRSIDQGVPIEYQCLLVTRQVQWVYLDEIGELAKSSVGLGMVQLVVENERTAEAQARQLIQKAQQQLQDEALKRKVLELIETILVYKLPQLSRQELEAMFGLSDLKQTRYFQDVREEGKQEGKQEAKLETVPRLLQLGLSVEQIATALDLPVEVVQQVAQKQADS
jgi:predicted transposase/invertase (TIGR01784 family)